MFSIPIYYLLKGSKWVSWEHSHIKQWLCLHDNFTFHSWRLSITHISYHFPFTGVTHLPQYPAVTNIQPLKRGSRKDVWITATFENRKRLPQHVKVLTAALSSNEVRLATIKTCCSWFVKVKRMVLNKETHIILEMLPPARQIRQAIWLPYLHEIATLISWSPLIRSGIGQNVFCTVGDSI